MPIIAKNIIVGNTKVESVETKPPQIKREPVAPIIPLEQVSLVPKQLEKKYQEEKEHGIMINHDDIRHSAYHLDMILKDI